ncbi:SAG family member [Eimeria mitis]|uniref:SAG family member n=1 Tax=Eimeria mitis TaxID=44415 RepID=U6JT03_9EIME|nr:SAG family member [Eimeria mitis]CDJ28590.1 SAG family member [Eimeria mitis]
MAPLKLLTVVSSSLFFLARANGDPAPNQTTYNVALGEEGKCLAEVNAARVAAGFSELTKATQAASRLPQGGKFPQSEQPKWAWKPVCEALIPTTEKSRSTSNSEDAADFQSGTYAYLPIDNADSVDCKAVVDKWKEAYTNFDGLPPANKEEKNLYDNQENVSFVALYNPSTEATADCRVVTCTKTTPAAGAAAAGGTDSTGQNTETKASALICMTAPDVLADKEKAPFTEEQWEQIVTALEGSASAVAPGVVGFALAIVGLSML